MRLTLLDPPVLVAVVDATGPRPALLLAIRGERRYVQLSRGAGRNHLCWVDAHAVAPAGDPAPVPAERPVGRATGLPWVRPRPER